MSKAAGDLQAAYMDYVMLIIVFISTAICLVCQANYYRM